MSWQHDFDNKVKRQLLRAMCVGAFRLRTRPEETGARVDDTTRRNKTRVGSCIALLVVCSMARTERYARLIIPFFSAALAAILRESCYRFDIFRIFRYTSNLFPTSQRSQWISPSLIPRCTHAFRFQVRCALDEENMMT